MRLPRADGAPHKEALPSGPIPRIDGAVKVVWSLRDAAEGEFIPPFKELVLNLAVTDGCSCQVTILSPVLSYTSRLPPIFFSVCRAREQREHS